MASPQVPLKLTYRRNDTVPPVYVVGDFSNPPWQPLEMDVTKGEDGQHVFTKMVDVSEGSQIQYKFRIGSGDWWVVDENTETGEYSSYCLGTTCPTPSPLTFRTMGANLRSPVTDSQGNVNNILKASAACSNTEPEVPEPEASPLKPSPSGQDESQSPVVTESASDVAEIATDTNNNDKDAPSHHACPMFSHECVIVPGKDAVDDEAVITDDYEPRRLSGHRPHEYAEDQDIDADDPALERFPSDSASIFAAIRRLSTSVEEDRTFPQGTAPSHIINSPNLSSSDGSPDGQNLTVPQAGQLSHGEQQSHGEKRNRSLSASGGSVSSLNAIAEDEDERPDDELDGFPDEGATPADQDPKSLVEPSQPGDEEEEIAVTLPNGTTGPVERPGPAVKSAIKVESPASDDDEGIAMCNAGREKPAGANLDRADIMIPEPVKDLHVAHPHIMEPPLCSSTPVPEEDRFDSADLANPEGLAVNHTRAASPSVIVACITDDRDAHSSAHDDDDGLRKRNVDRPLSRISIHKPIPEATHRANWLTAFLQLLFVDWIGGSLSRLWRGKYVA